MGSLALNPDNVIKLWTRNGDCEIQLLYGDITKLPLEEKMDILMVSAFPGDYSPMHGTLIGALLYNLGISVERLAQQKELDLRHHFSCWLSKLITTEGSPFSRILCFERRRGNFTVAQQISDMFRVFVPVFNNQENTVITPLLATGHQGFNQAGICGAMVDAAAHWIRAGLPLRCLKIVVYGKIDKDVVNMFQALKVKLMAKNEQLKRSVFSKTFDVYVSFSPIDERWVNKIKNAFEKKKQSIKIYAKHQDFDTNKVWQNNIFKVMVGCKRIIAVLTPAFLDSTECLEQYNMAMCCNRLVGMEVLAPFYIETVSSLPTYMGLVQWVDCRVRKEGDSAEEKLSSACTKIVEKLDDILLTPSGGDTIQYKQQLTPSVEAEKFKYDVFISYSHKNPDQAEALLQAFKEIDETVKVFYDRSALTTGSNWQNLLYQCLGQAKCVIALVSPTYLSSTVCKEEYNIALARFLTKDEGMQFVPVCISDIEAIPAAFAQIKMVDARGCNFESAKEKIAMAVTDFLVKESPRRFEELLNNVSLEYNLEEMLNELRSSEVASQYSVTQKDGLQRHPPLRVDNKDERQLVTQVLGENEEDEIDDFDIVLSYANDAMNLAGAFCYIIDKLYSGLKISVFQKSSHHRLKALDMATKVVVFLSQDFVKTEHFMQELHQVLSRQRPEKKRILYLIKVNKLPNHPFFPNLLPYDLSGTDKVWFDLEKKFIKGNKTSGNRKIVSTTRMSFAGNFTCDYAEYFVMTKAAEDVLASILNQNSRNTTGTGIEQKIDFFMNYYVCFQLEYNLEEMLNELRSSEVASQYSVTQKDGLQRHPPLRVDNKDERQLVTQVLGENEEDEIDDFDIVLSYANDAMNLAGAFCYIIDKLYSGLKISVFQKSSHHRLKALDMATKVVVFLSQDFVKTEHFMQELHQVLSRQRPEKKRILYLIKVNKLPNHPFFPNLLPYDLSGTDKVWFDLEKKFIKGNKTSGNRKIVSTTRMSFAGNFTCDYAEYFVMTKAAEDVLASILNQNPEDDKPRPNQINIVEVEMKLHKTDQIDQSLTLNECLKDAPCITNSPSKDQQQITEKVEPQSHPRAGTPELATENQETTANKKSQNDATANRTEDKKSHDEQLNVEHPGTRPDTEQKDDEINVKDKKSNEQEVIVEHSGARHKTDNKNNEKQEKYFNEPKSKKVDSNDKVPAGEKNTENNASNKKTSRSCILI